MLLLFFCFFSTSTNAFKLPGLKNVVLKTSVSMVSSISNDLPRTILNPLPKVYVYDHCPFCVRVRLALGLKNVKHNIIFLANDDIPTPTALVGKKIAPIFEVFGEKPLPESLDIISKIDSDSRFGSTSYFKPFSKRPDIKQWQEKVADINRILQRPRYMMTVLPEFNQQDGKDAFVYNHALAPYEKSEWQKTLTQEERWLKYSQAYEQSLLLIGEANKSLEDLEPLIFNEHYCTEGGISIDDIDLWSRLRSLTLVKGIVWPEKLGKYMLNLSIKGDVPLYNAIAL